MEKEMSVASKRGFNKAAYWKLLGDTLPHVIHTEEENERYIAQLEALDDLPKLSPEQQELAALLTLLITNFEDRRYQLNASAAPRDVVRHLMEANNLKQSDLTDIFGTRSVISEVLSGNRELSKTHIQRLSERFHISPEVFFPAMPSSR